MTSTLKVAAIYLLSLMLVACGGGGSLSNDGGGNPTPSTYSISFSVVDEQGGAVDHVNGELSASAPWTVQAKVTKDGSAQAGVTVTFTLADGEVASLSKGSDTTNSDGVAEVQVLAGGKKGSVVLSARLIDNTEATLSFDSAGDGNSTTVDIAKLSLFASSTQLPSSGTDEIELIALVQDSANALLEGIEVQFSASSGQLSPGSAVTADDGTARKMLTTLNEAENREIEVKAVAGGKEQILMVKVVGTSVRINGPSSVIVNDEAELAISVTDSDGKGINNAPVSLAASNGNFVGDTTNLRTDGNGQILVRYTASAAGQDTITASALNAQASFTVNVQQDNFAFQGLSNTTIKQIPINTDAIITINWSKNGIAYQGGTVTFNASRGQFNNSSVVTNSSGQASVTIRSSNAGVSAISAEGRDTNGNIVTARAEVEFVATVAHSIIVDATPDVVGPDGQTATITALVRDPDGNLVKGKQVNFTVDDTSSGKLSPNSGVTDSRGVATTVFTSEAVSSNEAVRVTATVADTPAVSGFTDLTVGARAFDITIGTGNFIVVPEGDNTTYMKEFAVFVSTSNGTPAKDVRLTASVMPLPLTLGGSYSKGYWQWNAILEVWEPIVTVTCDNEDINADGVLDAGEDTNNDTFLTPGIIGTLKFADNNNVTDENGRATLEYRYPKDRAPWTSVVIQVNSESARSEDAEDQRYRLDYSAEEANNENGSMAPNWFGRGLTCTDRL